MGSLVVQAVGELLEKHGMVFAVAILAALITAIATVYFQARWRSRSDHFNAIKAGVLTPLRFALESFYLPMLRGEIGPVTISRTLEPLDGTLADPRQVWVERLAPQTPTATRSTSFFTDSHESRNELDTVLYRDTKHRHLKRLMQDFETFSEAVHRYMSRMLTEAQRISQIIHEQSNLPSSNGLTLHLEKPWINHDALAVFVVNWVLNTSAVNPWRGPDRCRLEIAGQIVAETKSEAEIDALMLTLEDLCKDRAWATDIGHDTKALLDQGQEIANRLAEALIAARLPGNCPSIG